MSGISTYQPSSTIITIQFRSPSFPSPGSDGMSASDFGKHSASSSSSSTISRSKNCRMIFINLSALSVSPCCLYLELGVFFGGGRNIGHAEDTMKIQYGKNTEILHILSGKNRWFRIDVPFNAARSARRLEDLELDPSTPLPSSSNMSAALRVSPSCVIT